MIEENFDTKFETTLSKLDKMTRPVKQLNQKRASNQQAFIEALIEWVDLMSVSFRSVNHPLFQEMLQCPNPDFSVPVHNRLERHIMRLSEVY
jgi:hypothetical protein